MKSKRTVSASMVAIAVACFAVPWGLSRYHEKQRLASAHKSSVFPSAQLAQLDLLVQKRFAVVPTNNFGMSRIGPRHELFRPVTADEQAVIDDLRAARYDVVFYVAGRNYLVGWPTAGAYPASLQGPIYMTQPSPLQVRATQKLETSKYSSFLNQPVFSSKQKPRDLPREDELKNPLQGMLESGSRWDHTATPDVKRYRAGRWNVLAVPVRASDKACVACHNYISRRDPPRLGDPLGIALYVYRFPNTVPSTKQMKKAK